MARIQRITPDTPGLQPAEASEVFDHMERFASYGFNKSHAAAYAAIGFQTAYLKRHHPEAFFAASMNLAIGEIADLAVFAGEMKKRGIPLLPPMINLSQARFEPLRGRTRLGIAYGLAAVRGVGFQAAEAIVTERAAHGRFASFEDFRARIGNRIPKKAMQSLVHAGAFDKLCASRADASARAEESLAPGGAAQFSLFDVEPAFDTRPTLPEWDKATLLDKEFDALGFWLTGHPLDGFRRVDGRSPITLVGALEGRTDLPRQARIAASILDHDTRGTKSGGVMAILRLSDPHSTFEAIAFDETWANIRHLVQKKATLVFTVQPQQDDGELRLLIQGVETSTQAQRQAA